MSKTSELVAVAMSGGVDSSVAVALLKEEGYEVVGITMDLLPSSDEGDSFQKVVKDAKKVAEFFKIQHYVLDLKDAFIENVINDFYRQYSAGRTPNPCIKCNEKIKFQALLEGALKLGASYLATGHYSRISKDETRGRHLLLRALDPLKDQSYVLYRLNQWQLSHLLFPLGHMNKREIRKKAFEIGLPVADKADSQDICFITNGDYRGFLHNHFPQLSNSGFIEDKTGKVMGTHQGLAFYTIGQRKGLGISWNSPLYVIDLDVERNVVVVGEEKDLLCSSFLVVDEKFIPFDDLNTSMDVTIKIRYSAYEVPGTIQPFSQGHILVELHKPQRAVTPGQSAVFYNDDIVVGGGIIKNRLG